MAEADLQKKKEKKLVDLSDEQLANSYGLVQFIYSLNRQLLFSIYIDEKKKEKEIKKMLALVSISAAVYRCR
jgi:hypothetical protein